MLNFSNDEKILARILQRQSGRNALKKLIGVELTSVSEEEAKTIEAEQASAKPRVAVLRPVYDKPEPEAQEGLNQLAQFTRQSGVAEIFAPEGIRDASVVHWTRNHLLSKLLKTKERWTHVLFIDDDIVPPADALVRMLSHGKDIVGALCTKRMFPPMPTAKEFDKDNGAIRPMLELKGDEGLIEVGAIGTGMILLSRHSLEQIAEAYFACLYEKKYLGMGDEAASRIRERRLKFYDDFKDAFWFRFLPTVSGAGEYGEDIGFCVVAHEICEILVYCDTTIQPQHIGRYGFSIKDFLPYQAHMLRKSHSKVLGNPTEDMQFSGDEASAAETEKQADDLARESGEFPFLESDMKISVIAPTRGRPDSVKRLVDSIRATSHAMPEVIVYVDEDDETMRDEIEGVTYLRGPRITLSQCWNEAAKIATGDILMVGADDIVFKTPQWDRMVISTFESCPDKLILVHGDDGHWGKDFGTHPLVHRKWYEAVGYLLPPYFVSDYGDTWLNEVANQLGRRVYLPFVTDHLHPAWNKGPWDKTHGERLDRGAKANVADLYYKMKPNLLADVDKLRAAIKVSAEAVPVG